MSEIFLVWRTWGHSWWFVQLHQVKNARKIHDQNDIGWYQEGIKINIGIFYDCKSQTMHDVVGRKIPHDTLVLQKIICPWCMDPIKKKAKSQREAFRCGRLAEYQIEGSIPHFIIQHSNDTISIVSIAGVVLMRYSHALIASVFPYGIGILRCTQSDSFPDSAKLVPLISRKTYPIHANIQHGLWFMCLM